MPFPQIVGARDAARQVEFRRYQRGVNPGEYSAVMANVGDYSSPLERPGQGRRVSQHKNQPNASEASNKVGRPAFTSDDSGGVLTPGARRQQFRVLLAFSPDAIVMVDKDGLVSEYNPAAEALLGTPRPTAVGAPVWNLFVPPYSEHFNTAWEQLLAGGVALRFELQWSKGDGPKQELGVIVAPIRSSGTLVGAVMILRSLSADDTLPGSLLRQEAATPVSDWRPGSVEGEVDGPTGLLGRRWLQWYLSTPPTTGMGRGVAVFDFEGFDQMNVAYGADAAYDVVNEFAALLTTLDTSGTFAHLRANVFVFVVDAMDPVDALNTFVSAMTAALEKPFAVGDDELWLIPSIGLASSALVAGGDLLAAARDALQTARETRGSGAVYYDASMEASATSTFRLANDLRRAIERNEFRLHYQPIMEFATNEITGVEALVRWERPGVGLLAPGFFIDVAERTGQIIPLGEWVMRTACANAWRLGNHSGGPRTMSINVSARQFRDPGLVATLRKATIDGKCAPSTIVIEVTESLLLHDLKTVAASLQAIKALDVGLDLDDFGTGYSSLQYLRNLPIDRLKVDQGFVAGLGVSSADTAIVASTIALAHALGLKAIAEGVETNGQLALLREMGCDFAQGYLLSRPVDMETFTTWLDAYVPDALLPSTPESVADSVVALVRERTEVADLRDTTADERDTTADERERVADLRDVAATDREQAEDERERAD